MEPAVLIAIIGVLAAPFAALITWMLNRKKHIADIYAALSESSQTAVETMQLTMGELRLELRDARDKIDNLMMENRQLKADLIELKDMNVRLLSENQTLKQQLEELAERIRHYHASSDES